MSERTHGGRRPGAGRKPRFEAPMHRLSVSLPPADIAWLTELGDGRVAEGLRRALALARTTTGYGSQRREQSP